MKKSHKAKSPGTVLVPNTCLNKGRSRYSLTKRARIVDNRELVVSLRSYQSQSSTRGLLWFASMSLEGRKMRKKGSRFLWDFNLLLSVTVEHRMRQSTK